MVCFSWNRGKRVDSTITYYQDKKGNIFISKDNFSHSCQIVSHTGNIILRKEWINALYHLMNNKDSDLIEILFNDFINGSLLH